MSSSARNKKVAISVFWFRRDLRLTDNCGLYHALKSEQAVLPLFIFDTEILEKLPHKEDRRVCFIYDALMNIQTELLKVGGSLLVIKGKPIEVFNKLIIQYDIQAVYTNHDYEPYAIDRDFRVSELLKSKNILFHSFKDQVIFEKAEIVKNDGTPYTIFTPYSKTWKAKLNEHPISSFASEKLLSRIYKSIPLLIPDIKALGFIPVETIDVTSNINEEIIRNYHDTRNIPSIAGTTNLSTALRFGTVSIRKLVITATKLNEPWLNELIWREFFMMILFHYPYVVHSSFKRKYDGIIWRNNENEFNKWCIGDTGYPIVDAGMRQLNETGLMHNRVRMVVASFLTKHLLIDWRWGESYFADHLLDYELSSNNGNWQWAAGCGCDSAPYFRIFNPYEQVKRFDPKLIYITRWVKNLNEMDYPQPIVDHKFARDRVLVAYKKALGEN